MNNEKLWRQLDQYIDLYKFHWELALKLCIFFLGVAGAIAAYVIKNQNVDYMDFTLLLPIALCLFGLWLCHRSLPGLHLIRNETKRFGQELELETHPEFRSLIAFVGALRFIFGAVSLGLVILWFTLQCNS